MSRHPTVEPEWSINRVSPDTRRCGPASAGPQRAHSLSLDVECRDSRAPVGQSGTSAVTTTNGPAEILVERAGLLDRLTRQPQRVAVHRHCAVVAPAGGAHAAADGRITGEAV